MMSPASPALNRVLTGTSTPPAVSRPNAAMIHSAELGAQIATRSPFSIPAESNAPAATRTRSASSANVSRTGPSTTASAVPQRSAALSTIRGMVAASSLSLRLMSCGHQPGQVAAHDLGLLLLGQLGPLVEHVDVPDRLGQALRVRVVGAEQHPVDADDV